MLCYITLYYSIVSRRLMPDVVVSDSQAAADLRNQICSYFLSASCFCVVCLYVFTLFNKHLVLLC